MKVSGTAFIILTVFIAVLLAYFFWPASPAPKRLYEPENLTEGQCVLQVLGKKGALFEQMKRECRVLVVLNGSGVITEIIEN